MVLVTGGNNSSATADKGGCRLSFSFLNQPTDLHPQNICDVIIKSFVVVYAPIKSYASNYSGAYITD